MHFGEIFGDALDKALLRAAFFAENHSIKGLLSLSRLRGIQGVSDEFVSDALGWNQVLHAPALDIVFGDHVFLHMETLDDKRLHALIQGAVFPLAYLAGAMWVKRFGYKHLLESFEETAIERVGYLGHSYTIWCSFMEIEPYLETDAQKILAAERFVEFCASQLSTPDWTPAYPIDFALASHNLEDHAIISSILSKPGFYGHRLIGLSYFLKYRARLSTKQWKHCMKRMYDESQKTVGSSAHDIEVPLSEGPNALNEKAIEPAIVEYLKRAPREVHSLTLADAICELWNHVGTEHRQHLLDVLQVYGEWKVQRSASGERRE